MKQTTRIMDMKLFKKYQDYRKRQATKMILSALSDRELKDIGISRSEIDYVSRTT